MAGEAPIRVLALIPPIERHVGHWACSSPGLDVHRVIMDEDAATPRILEAMQVHGPQVVAIIGKQAGQYLDLLDHLAGGEPRLASLPRVYRCQNTMLTHRLKGRAPTRQFLASLNGWFRCACDERFSLVLVQTVDDVPLIREVLAPTPVALCPFGYDPDLFDPDLPELDRVTDVGCYLTLRDDLRRVQLVETAEVICRRRGWTFRFQEGKYWHDYTTAIRTSRICLHRSDQSEVPFRMVETTILGAVFLTDPLHYHAETFFELGSEYLTYQPDLSDLEGVLEELLTNERYLQTIARAGQQRARKYSWPCIAEEYVVPALRHLLDGVKNPVSL
ncbi:MAG: glycosyltransferase [Gemmataceae bacterium]